MNKTAVLLFTLAFVCAPLLAGALQERNITDEPAASRPQAPAQQAPATPAAKEPAPAPAEAPAYQPSESPKPSSGGTWTPPPASQEAAPAEPAPSSGGGRIFDMPEARQVQVSTYSRKEVDEQVMGFFEGGARGLADLISRAFERYGEPTGFIKGNEGAGALVVGLRYGEGWLYLKNGKKAYVYWQSPSVGFDLGVNASKVFCLVYNMTDPSQIYQRFPSVDGSAYVVGGFGMNYQQSGKVVLAPIRFGVGLRLGVNAGYMGFTKERTINPF
ncbi:MAG: DUF1134 domain-containing protein [Thermodesulfobacteriota bacterium]